jgi:hypothetical protein
MRFKKGRQKIRINREKFIKKILNRKDPFDKQIIKLIKQGELTLDILEI